MTEQPSASSSSSSSSPQFVGIDVSKDKLDVVVDPAGTRLCVANDDAGAWRS